MALVQWKQISPQLGDYGNLTGSLEITGSLTINGALFTGGGGSVQTLSLNGYELSISQGNTVILPSSSAADTGSLITSASSSGNTITFTKGDGSSFNITIDTGSASGGSTDISALNAFTSSIQIEVDSLIAATSSYLTSLPSGLLSGSDQVTASLDSRYALSGSVGGGSTDITSLNAFTASYFIDSASFDSRIASTTFDTSSLVTYTDFYTFTSSYEVDSASFDSRISDLAATGSVIAPIAIGSIGFDQYGNYSVSYGTGCSITTTSTGDYSVTLDTAQPNAEYAVMFNAAGYTDLTEIEITNQTTTGFDINGYDSQGNPRGQRIDFVVYGKDPLQSVRVLVSGSAGATDITALNAFTSSYYIDSASFDQRISNITSSAADTSGLLTTSSYQIDSASFDSRISSINTSGDTSFNGNRVVSNTLLGDLYTGSFNAGTTGSIQDFLDAIFFPTSAPTATFTEQTSKFNTNLATTGTNLVSVSLTDTVDNSPYTLVLGGINEEDFTAVPTNAESSSWEIRAKSTFSAGTYSYDVTVGDSTNAERTYSGRSITIAQASSGTLSTTGNLYIIESATSGPIYLSSTGRSGAQGRVTVSYSPNYGSQVASGFSSNNPYIAINSTTGLLSVGTPISGSGNIEGAILNADISWTDQYNNTSTAPINVQVTRNNAPSITETNNTANLNTNLAVSGALLCTISFSDPEGDAIDHTSFTFQDASNKLVATRDGSVYRVRPNTDLTAATYAFVSSIKDVHGFNTTTEVHSFTINQAVNGTLTGDTTVYIVESALNGAVYRDATGYNNGNPAQISVNYSPNYGSQTPTFTSSNPAIVVDTNGYLTLGLDLSGSITQSGDSYSSDITWTDQYGNSGTGPVQAIVFGNQSPSVTYTVQSFNSSEAISGSNIGTVTITDTESNSPFTLTLGGTSGSLFNAVPQNAASSSWFIQPLSSLVEGDYPTTVTVRDSYSELSVSSKTITVTSPITDTLYVYDVGQNSITYNNDLGIQTTTSATEPITAISYTGVGFLEKIEDGNLGDLSFTYNWGSTKTATLLASGSGTSVNQILTDFGAIPKTNNNRFVIIMPSGSAMGGVPLQTTDSYGQSVPDQYVLEVAVDGVAIGSGLGTTEPSNIHKIALNSPVNGVSDYIMVGPRNSPAPSTSIELRLIAVSGSAV